MKIIPNIKVKDMDFTEGIVTRAFALKNGAICSTGRKNAYRYSFLKGQGGSAKEETWNRDSHIHNCCKSRVSWRHKTDCPRLNF